MPLGIFRGAKIRARLGQDSEVGHHPAIVASRGAMAEELRGVVRGTEIGTGNLTQAQRAGLALQNRTEVEPSTSSAGRPRKIKGLEDFRSYFITLATNSYATMH